MHPKSINAIFSFYTRYNQLQMSLVELASHVNTNAKVLSEAGGPGRFAVVFKNGGAVLVEHVRPICDLEQKAPCAEGKEAEAQGYEIRETLGGPTAIVPKDQATALLNEGPMFKYAFGDQPERNAILQVPTPDGGRRSPARRDVEAGEASPGLSGVLRGRPDGRWQQPPSRPRRRVAPTAGGSGFKTLRELA